MLASHNGPSTLYSDLGRRPRSGISDEGLRIRTSDLNFVTHYPVLDTNSFRGDSRVTSPLIFPVLFSVTLRGPLVSSLRPRRGPGPSSRRFLRTSTSGSFVRSTGGVTSGPPGDVWLRLFVSVSLYACLSWFGSVFTVYVWTPGFTPDYPWVVDGTPPWVSVVLCPPAMSSHSCVEGVPSGSPIVAPVSPFHPACVTKLGGFLFGSNCLTLDLSVRGMDLTGKGEPLEDE